LNFDLVSMVSMIRKMACLFFLRVARGHAAAAITATLQERYGRAKATSRSASMILLMMKPIALQGGHLHNTFRGTAQALCLIPAPE
jgi:hypothetical protein